MIILIKLIYDYSSWLYGACAIAALFFLRAAILARRDRVQATFSLEREVARSREYKIMTAAIVILLVMAGVYSVERFVVPNVEIPYEMGKVEPTPIFIPTITPTPEPPTVTPTRTPTVLPMPVTATPDEPAPTPLPTAIPVPVAPACPNPGVRLTSPGSNAQVSGVVRITGSASIEGFQFYKVELGVGDRPSDWSFLFSNSSPVIDGTLGLWDTGPIPAGTYSLRLVVVDHTGNYPEPCSVTISVAK